MTRLYPPTDTPNGQESSNRYSLDGLYIVGLAIQIYEGGAKAKLLLELPKQAYVNQVDFGSLSPLSIEELSNHDTPEDCLVGIHGKVYDLTRFAGHPGGKQSIVSLCGTDRKSIFSSMHSANILPRVQEHMVGLLLDTTVPPENEKLHGRQRSAYFSGGVELSCVLPKK
jgi:hypothetical protein